jgi:hypothetical protein
MHCPLADLSRIEMEDGGDPFIRRAEMMCLSCQSVGAEHRGDEAAVFVFEPTEPTECSSFLRILH